MNRWKIIFSQVLALFLIVAICAPSGQVYAQEQSYISNQLNTFTATEPQGFGYPLATAGSTEFINSAYGVEEEGGQQVNVLYTSASGDNSVGSEAPAKFIVYDLDNRRILRDFPLPGAKVTWTHGTDSQGNVYIATQSNANVFRYSPVTKELESLGAIRASDGTLQTALYHVSFDSEDNAYFGTYPSALLVKYDITQKKFQIMKEKLFGGNYVKAHVIADNGYMYLFGATQTEAKFARLNLESGAVEELPEFSYTGPFQNHDGIKNVTNEKIPFDKVQGLTLRGNYIFAFVEATKPTNLAMLVIYDIANNRWLTEPENVIRNNGTHVPPALNNKVYVWDRGYLKLKAFDLTTGTYSVVAGFDANSVNPGMRGSTFIQFENQVDLPGLTLVTVQKNGTVTYNSFGYPDGSGGFSGRKKFGASQVGYENIPVDAGLQPKVIRALERGPQGTDTIAIGAYMGPVLGILNSKTDEIKYITMEQIEGMGEAHGKYYAGVYPKAEIYTIDFNTMDFSQSTKALVTKLSGSGLDQDRPFQLIEAGDYVAISTVPDYGVLDGALTLLPKADNTQKEVYKGIIPNQSIIGLAYKDGKIYGSTSVWGGLGIDPVDVNAKLFIFDLATKTVTKLVEPDLQNVSTSVMHIGGLSMGPNGDLWAISNGVIFEVNPETLEVIREFKTRDTSWSTNTAWYLPYQMDWLSDTLLVTNAGEVLTVIDTQTGEMRKLTNKQANLMAVSEDKKSIYFSSDRQYKLYKMGISFEQGQNNVLPKLELQNQSGPAGAEVLLPLSLVRDTSDMTSIHAIEFDMTFDGADLTLTAPAEGSIISVNYVAAENKYRVLIGYEPNGSSPSAELPDALGSFAFTIAANRPYGATTPISLSNIMVTNENGDLRMLANATATVTVQGDTIAPIIDLTASTTDYAETVTVTVAGDGTGSAIAETKWAEGEQTLEDIRTSGVLLTGSSFTATKKGIYTVYMKDAAGNEAIKTIDIPNIVIKGDANDDGVVNLLDWQKLANYILLKETPNDRQAFASRLNAGNTIDVGDWVLLAKMLVN